MNKLVRGLSLQILLAGCSSGLNLLDSGARIPPENRPLSLDRAAATESPALLGPDGGCFVRLLVPAHDLDLQDSLWAYWRIDGLYAAVSIARPDGTWTREVTLEFSTRRFPSLVPLGVHHVDVLVSDGPFDVEGNPEPLPFPLLDGGVQLPSVGAHEWLLETTSGC